MSDPTEDAIAHLMEEAFPDARVDVSSRDGDRVHYSLSVYSQAFAGKTLLQQHRMVYKILHDYIGAHVHALSLQTGVPHE